MYKRVKKGPQLEIADRRKRRRGQIQMHRRRVQKKYPYRENLRRHIRLQHEAPPKAAKREADSSADKSRSAKR